MGKLLGIGVNPVLVASGPCTVLRIPPTMSLPVRLSCPSHFATTNVFLCTAPSRTALAWSKAKACYTDRTPETRMFYSTRVSAALNVCFRPKTVIRGEWLRSVEDWAVIELLLTRPERNVER